MKSAVKRYLLLVIAFAIPVITITTISRAKDDSSSILPENLAPKARITASAEFNESYLARNVADGIIPLPMSGDDLGKSWCVPGVANPSADMTFEWNTPVTVAEVVYYGRTSFFMEEIWKDCDIYLDNATSPAAEGHFIIGHGPQRVKLPFPARVSKLRIHFKNAYSGNPGAAEIQIFPTNTNDNALPRFAPNGKLYMLTNPGVDVVDCTKLRKLIMRIAEVNGDNYKKFREHLTRLDKLEKAQRNDENIDAKLVVLQQSALLFDADKFLVIKRQEINPSHVYTYHCEGFRPGGGLYVVKKGESTDKGKELVSSPQGQILDCDLSYDGKVVLFSWKQKASEGYHVWMINIDGSGLKQLTRGEWHDYNACWLPDGGIAFLSTRDPQFAYCWFAPVGILYRMDANGKNTERLSSNYLNDFTPYPLDDGRIIYTRWEYVDRPAIPIQSLWTINPDGTGLAGYYGNRVISPGTFMEARSIPGTSKIICTMTGHNGPARGAIGIIDRSKGDNAQESIINITPDTPVPAVDQGYGNTDGSKQYSCPQPLDAERFLVSIRGPVIVRDIAGTCESTVIPSPADGMMLFNAQPVRPRFKPPVIPAVLPADYKSQQTAKIFLQDIYQGLEPYVKRGDVKTLRVVREMEKTVRIDPTKMAFGFQFPVISCGATYAGKDVIGEVPVNPDGSAFFEVPAGKPVYFMTLDDKGRAVQRMRTFTHLMPGESQSCIGCHESRAKTSKMSKLSMALNTTARKLDPPEWGAGGFDYARIVQPVLDKYCTSCHNPRHPSGKVDLTGSKTDFFNVSYEYLARGTKGTPIVAEYDNPYTSWIPTYNGMEKNILQIQPMSWGSPKSKLADIIISGHPDTNGKPRFQMDDKSRRRVLAWIDLNVPYYGTSETAYPDNLGCRRIYPEELDAVLTDVVKRRCSDCHQGGNIPRKVWTRITEPEMNNFLLAPLARSAGGTEAFGMNIFKTKNDPDYQAILETFDPVIDMLKKNPRQDMPGAKSAPDVCRDRK
ncbi:MAG: HzsA-related protein [Armatimonadota bacterium]